MPGSILKAEIRSRIWSLLTRTGIALFPGAYGRTPRFHGVRKVVEQFHQLDQWTRAKRVLVLSEPVLDRIRRAVVRDGKVLVVPDLTRTEGWIIEVDPAAVGVERALEGASALGVAEREVPQGVRFLRGQEIFPVDLMIIGAVGVDRHGARVGKGAGEADLVYALGRDRGFITAETPVAVLVHDLQLLEEPATREPTDLPIDLIVTPKGTHRVRSMHMRPKGLDPAMITPERLAAFPGLRRMLDREGIDLPPTPSGTL